MNMKMMRLAAVWVETLAAAVPQALSNAQAPQGEPAYVMFKNQEYGVKEASGMVAVIILRTGATNAFAVEYFSSDGPAVPGEDYLEVARTLSFAAAGTEKVILVSILDDPVADEYSEYFRLTLTN